MALATAEPPSLILTETPTFEQLSPWWEAMWSDPAVLHLSFSDLMPRSLPAFLESDVRIVLVCAGDTYTTAFWGRWCMNPP